MPTPEDALNHIAAKLDLPGLETTELLQAYAAIIEELRSRDVVRTSNNPLADYTESLVCEKLHLRQEGNSTAGYDAVDTAGTKFQIKGRRVTPQNASLQLSAIRKLQERQFDYLVGVVFERDFSIRYAAKIPHGVIGPHSRFSHHSNAHLFNLTPDILELPEVDNITELITG